jgi:protein-S-isoprenylcysteine O-methyltransferase Ste14
MTGPSANPNASRAGWRDLSRRTAVFVGLCFWFVGIPLGHGVMPWMISLMAVHHGWHAGRPGPWNLIGLFPLALGFTGLAWVFVTGLSRVSELPTRVKLGLAPVMLLTSGPFALSRNPMYLSALTLWLGWAIFYGSLAIAAVWPGMWAGLNFIIVPREERSLERCFGGSYLRYKQDVRRWLGRINHPDCERGTPL